MNETNFYQPRLAKLTGKELMFAQESLEDYYHRKSELDIPDFDFAASSSAHPIMTRRIGLQSDDSFYFSMDAFQITYNFSSAIRKNNFPMRGALPSSGTYGAPGFSFRLLYEYLCEAYNGGQPFIDTYFKQVFPTRSVYADFAAINDVIQQHIDEEQVDIYMTLPLKADGTPDMRYAKSKKFMDFKVWQDPIINGDCKKIASAIRDDIIVCLSTGRIPLLRGTMVNPATKKIRDKFIGLDPNRRFFASGQLIKHLNIYVAIGRAA